MDNCENPIAGLSIWLAEIKPKWLSEKGTGNRDFGSYKIFYVRTIDIVHRVNFLGLNPKALDLSDESNKDSYLHIINSWKNGRFIDNPTLTLTQNELRFSDGRHRTILAYHLGETALPVLIHETMIDDINRKVEIFEQKPFFN